ncbi:MAG: sugar phosphate isomerase/epimerase [Clostridiales bacterium]|jgi:sugar phosphate isomerase/epimerase|nr:sugar phosphate isomerase/epimerase [Clostridiales bacterium]
MKLRVFHRPWALTCPLEEVFEIIKREGYDGIEDNVPSKENSDKFKNLLKEYNMPYIAVIRTSGPNHLDSLRYQMEEAAKFDPYLINSQSGCDFEDFSWQFNFFEQALKFENELGVVLAHETHRKRSTFTPWNTLKLVREFPALHLTADFSHWCCVTESLLENFFEAIEEITKNVVHIHARVGYKEGPQVPHPGAPEYTEELLTHEIWWKMIINNALNQNREILTMNPEYGHAGNRYMHTLPFTDQPVSDDRQVCLWAKDRFKDLFEQTINK